MTIDGDMLTDQMNRARYRNGRFERLEHGEWVAWPILGMDKLGRDAAARIIANGGRRPRRDNGE